MNHAPIMQSEVDVAEVRIRAPRWPARGTSTMLRGAVIEELRRATGDEAHVDWHGHAADGTLREGVPPVLYRVRPDGLHLHLSGPRAHAHATQAAALRALRTPQGDVVEVESADVQCRREALTGAGRRLTGYTIESPIVPSEVQARRFPDDRRAVGAWVAVVLHEVVGHLLVEHGIDPRRLVVHADAWELVEVEWRHKVRERGIVGRFVVNASILDGCGLGRYRSEGFGEVRRAWSGRW